MSPPTLLIDVHGLGHRCYHAMGELKLQDTATGVVFGFLKSILSLGMLYDTNDFVFCWDNKGSKRKEFFPDYKSGRKKVVKTDEEIAAEKIFYKQLDDLGERILPCIGFMNHPYQKGYEADDIIAVITQRIMGDYIIVSTDADLWQLLKGNVRMHSQVKRMKPLLTDTAFYKEHGLKPEYWWMVKAIGGCNTDSVPGVKGVGDATAVKYLLNTLKKSSVKYKAIMENAEIINRNEMLVRLPYPGTEIPELVSNQFDLHQFTKICDEFGLASFLEEDVLTQWKGFFEGKTSKSGKRRESRQRMKDKMNREVS